MMESQMDKTIERDIEATVEVELFESLSSWMPKTASMAIPKLP